MMRISKFFSFLLITLMFGYSSLLAEPSSQSRNVSFSNITSNSVKITWINGNGGSRIVVITPTSETPASPVDGVEYTSNLDYVQAGVLGGGKVVFSETGQTRTITVTGLNSGTEYSARVYEFNNVPSNFDYNTNTAINNPRTFKTSINQPTGLAVANVTANNADLSWSATPGALGYYLTVGGTDYNNADIGNVTSIGLQGLTKSTNYSWSLKAYAENNNVSAATAGPNFTTLADATAPVFTVSYFADANYTTPLVMLDNTVGAGTYYLQVTSTEELISAPTVAIATQGTANDVATVKTNQIDYTHFAKTRVVALDPADDGTVTEQITVIGTDLNNNTTNVTLDGFKIDTKAPEVSLITKLDNYHFTVKFTEKVRKTSTLADNLVADNFTATVSGTNTGVTAATVVSATSIDGITYDVYVSYTGENVDFGGAPYSQDNTANIKFKVTGAQDYYNNNIDASNESANYALEATPFRVNGGGLDLYGAGSYPSDAYFANLTDAAYFSTEYSHHDILFAPTTISTPYEVYFNADVNLYSLNGTNVTLGASWYFDGGHTVITTQTGTEFILSGNGVDYANLTFENEGAEVTISNATFTNFVGSEAVYVTGASSVAVSDVAFGDGDYGVTLDGVQYTDLSNVSFSSMAETAIIAYDCEYVVVDGGYFDGIAGTAAIVADNSVIDLANSEFIDCVTGVDVTSGVETYVSYSTFETVGTGVKFTDNTGASHVYSNTFESGSIAIDNVGTSQVDALSNYYGSKNGPTVVGNTCGNGAEVKGDVLYSPWYYTNGLDVTAALIDDNTVEVTSAATVCAYDDSKVTINGSVPTGGPSVGTGESGYTYKWFRDGIEIVGQTSEDLTDYALELENYTMDPIVVKFKREVTSFLQATPCRNTSSEVEVTVNPRPVAPAVNATNDGKFCYGGDITMTTPQVSDYTYQWFDGNGDEIVGETSLTYTTSTSGDYTVVATNSYGCATSSSTYTVEELPEFFVTVADENYCSNSVSTEMTATVTGGSVGDTYTYQWFDGNDVAIIGATNATYTHVGSTPGTYHYSVKATLDGIGCEVTSSQATVTIYDIATPEITGGAIVCENSDITLTSANTNGNVTVDTYQWYFGDDEIVGATSATYTLTNAQVANEGNYYVEMTTTNGCVVKSAGHFVDVSELANITKFEYNDTFTTTEFVADNETSSFREDLSVTYTVTADFATGYKWYFDGTEIADETSNTLTLTYDDVKTLSGDNDEDIFTTTYSIYAEAISANDCTNDISYTTQLSVVPVPTKFVITNIIDEIGNRRETGVAFDVTIKTYNDYDILAGITNDTKFRLNRLADETANYEIVSVVSGGTYVANLDNIVTMNANANTIVVKVKLTKDVGSVDNKLGTADETTNTGMNLTNAESNTFTLMPALPAPPTNTKIVKTKAAATVSWNIASAAHHSFVILRETASLPGLATGPVEGVRYEHNLNFANGTNANDLDGDISNGGFRVVYFGTARNIQIQGLSSRTQYELKDYAVAGDFSDDAKELTTRYSNDVLSGANATVHTFKTLGKDAADDYVGFGDDATFTIETVYPNPVKDVINFTINSEVAGEYIINLLSVTGQTIQLPINTLNLGVGTYTQSIHLPSVAAGTYMLSFTSGDSAIVIPIVVMP